MIVTILDPGMLGQYILGNSHRQTESLEGEEGFADTAGRRGLVLADRCWVSILRFGFVSHDTCW